jgi:hypothetical protein
VSCPAPSRGQATGRAKIRVIGADNQAFPEPQPRLACWSRSAGLDCSRQPVRELCPRPIASATKHWWAQAVARRLGPAHSFRSRGSLSTAANTAGSAPSPAWGPELPPGAGANAAGSRSIGTQRPCILPSISWSTSRRTRLVRVLRLLRLLAEPYGESGKSRGSHGSRRERSVKRARSRPAAGVGGHLTPIEQRPSCQLRLPTRLLI